MSGKPRKTKPGTLARIDLTGCKYRGRVLDPFETDRKVEEQYLAGWLNWFELPIHRIAQAGAAAQQLNIVEDGGRPALEYVAVRPFILAAGDESWRDIEVAADVRCLMSWTFPFNTFEEVNYDYQGRSGLVLRLQDVRRHYFCGFQNGKQLVIAAREDANWIILNSADFSVDVDRVYRLTARCEGDRIDVTVDGKPWLMVRDGRWAGGPAGLYGNTLCRFRGVEVRASRAERAQIKLRGAERDAAEAAASRKVPQARLTHRIPLAIDRETTVTLGGRPAPVGGILPLDTDHVVAQWTRGNRAGLLAVDLQGKERWRRDLSAAGRRLFIQVADMDLDGAPEVAVIGDGEILILDGDTGQTRASAPFPEGCPFLGRRHDRAAGHFWIRVWHTNGTDRPPRIVLFQHGGWGGQTIWSYDHHLKPRWVHHSEGAHYGHNIAGYDVDGDGREEIVASYYALDDHGRFVWKVRNYDHIFMGEHADNLIVGPLEPGGRARVVAVCGNGGILFLDAATGEHLMQLRGLGHAQSLCAGNFRHDRPGREIWVYNDWGSAGIYFLFDGEGRILHRFQPDPRITGVETVTWWPDGRDLLMLQGTRETWGLWDSEGWRVVDFTRTKGVPPDLLPAETGLPIKPQFIPFRLTGAKTDSLFIAHGPELLVFAPGAASAKPR